MVEARARDPRRSGGRARRAWLPAALLVASAAAAVPAEAQDARVPMTLARAVAEGARSGPPLAEAQATRRATEELARDRGTSLPTSPQLEVQVGARHPRGLPLGPEVIFTVQQEVAARSLGGARQKAADWAARAAVDDVDRARLEAATVAALAWVALLEAQELQRVRGVAQADAEGLERLAEVRAAAGVVPPADRSLARAEVGSAKLAVLEGEGRATEARFGLALATGESMDLALLAEGDLARTEEKSVDARVVLERLSKHPAVRAAEARAAHASADADVAHAYNGPMFLFGASAWREGSGDKAAVANVTVPLPFFDPAHYERSRLATIAAGMSARALRVRAELEHDARLALHEREHTREVRAQLRDGVVAPLRRAMDAARAAYAAGTTDLAPLLLARRSLLAAEDRLVSANADVWRADVRVAAIAGTLLAEGKP